MPSPFFKNKLNNPAPQDLSLQTQPDSDPIRIPEGESLNVAGITPDNITVETTPAGDLQRIIVHPNRTRNSNNIDQPPVNTIPPEDNIVMDDRGQDRDSTFGISSINNSDQDPKPGLNTSPGDVVVIADSKDE